MGDSPAAPPPPVASPQGTARGQQGRRTQEPKGISQRDSEKSAERPWGKPKCSARGARPAPSPSWLRAPRVRAVQAGETQPCICHPHTRCGAVPRRAKRSEEESRGYCCSLAPAACGVPGVELCPPVSVLQQRVPGGISTAPCPSESQRGAQTPSLLQGCLWRSRRGPLPKGTLSKRGFTQKGTSSGHQCPSAKPFPSARLSCCTQTAPRPHLLPSPSAPGTCFCALLPQQGPAAFILLARIPETTGTKEEAAKGLRAPSPSHRPCQVPGFVAEQEPRVLCPLPPLPLHAGWQQGGLK